jgi:mannose-6-phosphate isomerase-like protein (cupin superfamily)
MLDVPFEDLSRPLLAWRRDVYCLPNVTNGILILENTFQEKGDPARYLHYNKDEWFYITEGEFLYEVGEETFRLHSGDSLLAPRRVSHLRTDSANYSLLPSTGKPPVVLVPVKPTRKFNIC